MPSPALSRRDLLEKCVASGLLVAGTSLLTSRALALFEAEPLHSTPRNELGPFYKKGAPRSAKLAVAGDPGLPLSISGRVVDTRSEPLEGAVMEFWHADPHGVYDLDGYRYRGRLAAAEKGAYTFETLMPGHYPDRVCAYIHYRVTAPGHEPLVTQLYFATDPAFEGDPDKNYKKDPILRSRELIRPVTLADPTGSSVVARVVFDLCLERS